MKLSHRKGKGKSMENMDLIETHFLLSRVKASDAEYKEGEAGYITIPESSSYVLAGRWKVVNLFSTDSDNAKHVNSIEDLVMLFVAEVAQTESEATVLVEVRDVYDSIMLSELIQKKAWYEEMNEKNPCAIIAKYYTDADSYKVGMY